VRKLPELVAIVGDSFRTDMTLPQMVTYAYTAQQIERDKIETFVIDENYLIGWRGAGGASLYIPDRQKIAALMEEFLRD
jgi:anionic cell wall polymer biosynthesis LytR-Cps2A-Psr (LCP) family protein